MLLGLFWTVLLLYGNASASNIPRPTQAPSTRSTSTTRPVHSVSSGPLGFSEVPFELTNGFVIEFEGQIGEMHGLKFVLDTGATRSVVDEKVARSLMVDLRPTRVLEFTKPVNLSEGRFSDIAFGSVHLTEVPLLVGDLAKLSAFAKDADAIIGSDLLLCSYLTIDYEQRRLTLGPFDPSAVTTDKREIVLQLRVHNVPVDVLLDTGVEGIVLFKDRLRKQMRAFELRNRSSVVIGEWCHALSATVPDVFLGPQPIDNEVLFVNGPSEKSLPGVSGYIGTASLHARCIEIDFQGKRFRWR
jgi:Aspartyl protease